jgi:hypothetical protein
VTRFSPLQRSDMEVNHEVPGMKRSLFFMRVLTTKVVNLLSTMGKLDSKLPAGSLIIPSANSYEVRVPIA